jgi:hypothetical protein
VLAFKSFHDVPDPVNVAKFPDTDAKANLDSGKTMP